LTNTASARTSAPNHNKRSPNIPRGCQLEQRHRVLSRRRVLGATCRWSPSTAALRLIRNSGGSASASGAAGNARSSAGTSAEAVARAAVSARRTVPTLVAREVRPTNEHKPHPAAERPVRTVWRARFRRGYRPRSSLALAAAGVSPRAARSARAATASTAQAVEAEEPGSTPLPTPARAAKVATDWSSSSSTSDRAPCGHRRAKSDYGPRMSCTSRRAASSTHSMEASSQAEGSR
jgi:hypothetical protein